ncbi:MULTISPECIES: DUF4301 family protein [unclassified Arcicella]|uniref:DUF4301 family protein n=1 Tax=unclassified Arcicella TaxID=2644986 RepID=UPI00285B2F3A|nr:MULTISPECIES: DUF4301 family protein [unclassified Arcicella]MDR6564886.1 hypothetical protein [Arcicella sp. BE51]MDR6814653.1 hypothetical protein [Arcicella sp. BE140]MDR6826099.1 hypothetical protein [Arcicella sp. BE139]
MFTQNDLNQIQELGINLETVEQQIQDFKDGFPFMQLQKAATPENGVIQLSDEKLAEYVSLYESKVKSITPLKFVPASGAASRMFKSLFAFLEEGKSDKSTNQFFERLPEFAFYDDLQKVLPENADEKTIADYYLTSKGLEYGSLPKGLLKFHKYETGNRTAIEEHLVEGANYANTDGIVKLHFTVSPEHLTRFKMLLDKVVPTYEATFGVSYEITFSEQRRSTDTIAVNLDNTPFREKDGSLLFRPAGHGALLANLNDIDANIVFIKNIDNVVPDRIKQTTYDYKKALAGVLVYYQDKIFDYQHQLTQFASQPLIIELTEFFEKELCVLQPSNFTDLPHNDKIAYFLKKLNRPLRVCGVVKNTGEPGGGPFWCKNADRTTSLQIVESAQVDLEDEKQKEIFNNSTHFNPVDLICALKNSKGEKFDLLKFRDSKTGFVTQKSKDGKDLKAQELPGLWNGAMADWNTIFVEVPLITFNPVKTVNDLLRDEHQ